MQIFSRFNRSGAIANYVETALVEERKVNSSTISNAIHLLGGSLGDVWETLSPMAAAGMVLLALAKNATLDNYLNGRGWEMVFELISACPQIVTRLSARTAAEIERRRPALADEILAKSWHLNLATGISNARDDAGSLHGAAGT